MLAAAMPITRRELLRRAGLLGAASLIPCFTACKSDPAADAGESGTGESGTGETGGGDELPNYEWEGELGPETSFSHGVASGDPLADSVILWTRISVDPDGGADAEVESFFEVALDPAFEMRVAADWIPSTNASRDFTIKIDLDALVPGTTYYYRFYALGRVSPIGRTRTAPSGSLEQLRFAVCTCASWAHGYFHAYTEIGARADLDAVLHLGDYIYEFGDGEYGDLRPLDPPTELSTLDDYRRRYRLYRGDSGLQEAHRQHPFIVTWDDHEVANDGWTDGAENHDETSEGPWAARREAGTQAYFEWLPLREGVPGRVYRQLPYGDLADLLVLDTRYEGRDLQINLVSDPDPLIAINEPDRQLLGAEQEAWLFERLSTSSSTWIVLVQQIMLAQFTLQVGEPGEPNRPLFSDLWDGYGGARQRLYSHLREQGISNLVVVTGDVHASFANELIDDPRVGYDPATGEGSVAVEFVTPSVTSPGLGFDDATLTVMRAANPHWKFVDVLRHGYVTLDVRPERVQADWWMYGGAQITSPEFSSSSPGPSWAVHAGTSVLDEADAPAPEKSDPPALAP
jgi:alkaline phosphatase D